jgi:hypothetical protein
MREMLGTLPLHAGMELWNYRTEHCSNDFTERKIPLQHALLMVFS